MTSAQRLLFVLYELSFGGVERQAELLAQAAKQAGHRVSLLVLGSEGPALSRFRAHCDVIQVLNANVHSDLDLQKRIRAALKSEYDFAFLFAVAKFPVLSNALRRAVPRQILHVGNPAGATWQERWKQQIRNWLFPCSAGLRLVANSRHTLESLQAHPFYRRFSLHVSLNCVRVPERPVVLRESCQPIRVGMVARLDPIKDHATLIRAVGLLRERGVGIECELLGRGALEDELKLLAVDLRLADGAVRFSGWSADVEDALRRWDIFVFSVTVREGFGNAAAEAMAFGLPCILTDVGPCREVGGDAAAYVPPGDPEALADRIAELAADAAQRRRLGAAAHEHAGKQFRAERKLGEFLSIGAES